ncbi:MAG: hypothetical protein E7199_06915 [Schwartzia succinivorans]|nr:hypothetical protein [Schwartzia succinivorans]
MKLGVGEFLLIIAPPFVSLVFLLLFCENNASVNSFAEMKNYNSGFLFLSIILMIFFFSVAASEKMDAAELSEKQYAKWRATKEEMRFFGTAVSGLGIYSVFSELFNPIGKLFFSAIAAYVLLLLGIHYRRLSTFLYWQELMEKKQPQ